MRITKEGIAILDNDTHISKWIEEAGRLDHDQNMLPLVLPYIKEGDTVIDCGAFIGDHTIAYLNKVGKIGHVVAIEPSADAYECLLYNTLEYKNCYHFNVGVSDTPGFFKLEHNENAGASHLSVRDGGNIKVISLDGFWAIERCDFIKFDIEGFELKALFGARSIIEAFHPKMLIEINRGALSKQGATPQQIFHFLTEYKYTYHNIYEEQFMEGDQYDIICL